MSNEEQLAWEARAGRPAAVAAFAAAVVSFTAGIYLQAALGGILDADESLRHAERQPSDFIVSGVLIAIGSLLVIPVIAYLYRVVRHRRPQLAPAALYLGTLGAITLAIIAVWQSIEVTNLAKDFFPFHPSPDASAISNAYDYLEAVDPKS